jgi:C4-dicarboxylate transporter DctM subunit
MGIGAIAVIVFSGLFGLILVGLPVAYCLGVTGLAGLIFAEGSKAWVVLTGGAALHHLASFGLLAIPLFILMSSYITESGMGPKLIDFTTKWFSRLPGYLHSAAIAACGVFSAMCGSSMATAAAIGGVILPEIKRRGHDMRMGLGAVAAGGTLGILIPPSNQFILYGVLTETSVARLFMAGIVPGILMVACFIAYTSIRSVRNPLMAPGSKDKITWGERWLALRQIWTGLILIASVLGGIFFGIVTPTEAAAVGGLLALLLGIFVLKKLTIAMSHQAAVKAVQITTMVGFIIMGGLILGRAITLLDLSGELIFMIEQSGLSRWSVMILVNLVLLFLGMLMDGAAIVMITTPLLFPVVISLGFDPIWFGVVFCINIELALITPPVGMNLFIIKGITDEKMIEIVKGVMPYFFIMVGMLIVVMIFPQLSLWLPTIMR